MKIFCHICMKETEQTKKIGHLFCNECRCITAFYPKELKKLKIKPFISKQIILGGG